MLTRLLIGVVIVFCLVTLALGEVPAKNPPTRASYTITWDDFNAQHNVCNTVCTKKETTYQTVCTDARVCVRTRTDDPSACIEYQTVHECTTEPIETCVQTAQQCHEEPKKLPDSDLIQVTRVTLFALASLFSRLFFRRHNVKMPKCLCWSRGRPQRVRASKGQ
jgi:hypothetical protein